MAEVSIQHVDEHAWHAEVLRRCVTAARQAASGFRGADVENLAGNLVVELLEMGEAERAGLLDDDKALYDRARNRFHAWKKTELRHQDRLQRKARQLERSWAYPGPTEVATKALEVEYLTKEVRERLDEDRKKRKRVAEAAGEEEDDLLLKLLQYEGLTPGTTEMEAARAIGLAEGKYRYVGVLRQRIRGLVEVVRARRFSNLCGRYWMFPRVNDGIDLVSEARTFEEHEAAFLAITQAPWAWLMSRRLPDKVPWNVVGCFEHAAMTSLQFMTLVTKRSGMSDVEAGRMIAVCLFSYAINWATYYSALRSGLRPLMPSEARIITEWMDHAVTSSPEIMTRNKYWQHLETLAHASGDTFLLQTASDLRSRHAPNRKIVVS